MVGVRPALLPDPADRVLPLCAVLPLHGAAGSPHDAAGAALLPGPRTLGPSGAGLLASRMHLRGTSTRYHRPCDPRAA
ncbi:hypothetical protein ACFV7Q_00420 [Streptomyces sp. NPDC059851]|uniref:hypothetical protein n=1 Tax=Streptomyces sp. NPDC059851 TaxID=3346971 RepID=UPI003650FE05